MKPKTINQAKNSNGDTTSSPPVLLVHKFIKELMMLMDKYGEEQAECLNGSPMVPDEQVAERPSPINLVAIE